MGYNGLEISNSYSAGMVVGSEYVGGLAGRSDWPGNVFRCYSISTVQADVYGGGLVGLNSGDTFTAVEVAEVSDCYSIVLENSQVSGLLIGVNGSMNDNDWTVTGGFGLITNCYASCNASGTMVTSGLVGYNEHGEARNCFWDAQACGVADSNEGGMPKTTTEMQTASTFLKAGWDFVDETENGTDDIWKISEGLDYPRLWWEKYGGGMGEPNNPYLIYTAEHLNVIGAEPNDWNKHFKLMADIDLAGYSYDRAVIAPDTNDIKSGFQGTSFVGVFDGNGYVISNLHIESGGHLGLFGQLDSGAMISNLGLEAVDVNGTGSYVGGLTGENKGSITMCHSTGEVKGGEYYIGGLVGYNSEGYIAKSYSNSEISGHRHVGGLVGHNKNARSDITTSYSTGTVTGNEGVGGLVGFNSGGIMSCYSISTVIGDRVVGGLVGSNVYQLSYKFPLNRGYITMSYSAGLVSGKEDVGGLLGLAAGLNILNESANFWDTETSEQTTSAGSTGKTTTEMQTAGTFLEAGWDFVDETDNGTEDIWWILEGQDYPRLWWETSN